MVAPPLVLTFPVKHISDDPWGRPWREIHDWVTWNLYLRPCGLRIQKGVSSSRFFLIIASFGGLCWVMLGLLIREKGQRWVQHWEIRSVRQMFVLEILIFSVFFSTRGIDFLSLFIWLWSSNDLKWIASLVSAVGYPIPRTMFIHVHQPGVHEFRPASLSVFRLDPIFVCFFSSNLTVFNIVP